MKNNYLKIATFSITLFLFFEMAYDVQCRHTKYLKHMKSLSLILKKLLIQYYISFSQIYFFHSLSEFCWNRLTYTERPVQLIVVFR